VVHLQADTEDQELRRERNPNVGVTADYPRFPLLRRRLLELFAGPLGPIGVTAGFRAAPELLRELRACGANAQQLTDAINAVRQEAGLPTISAAAVRKAASRVLKPLNVSATGAHPILAENCSDQQTSASAQAQTHLSLSRAHPDQSASGKSAQSASSVRPQEASWSTDNDMFQRAQDARRRRKEIDEI
jgi:hypothetical protein